MTIEYKVKIVDGVKQLLHDGSWSKWDSNRQKWRGLIYHSAPPHSDEIDWETIPDKSWREWGQDSVAVVLKDNKERIEEIMGHYPEGFLMERKNTLNVPAIETVDGEPAIHVSYDGVLSAHGTLNTIGVIIPSSDSVIGGWMNYAVPFAKSSDLGMTFARFAEEFKPYFRHHDDRFAEASTSCRGYWVPRPPDSRPKLST